MEIRQLTTLIRAAQFQSFSKAAESLGYSQSAVTVQIRDLEEELGVRLFDRMSKHVMLTSDGERFITYANSILDTIQLACNAMGEDRALDGRLTIGTLESLCNFRLPEVLRRYRRENPGVTIRVITGSPEEMIEQMERGEVDLICILDEPRYSNNWHKCIEVPEDVVFVCSPMMELPHDGSFLLEELLDRPFLLTEKDANYRRRFDQFLARRHMELAPSLETGDTAFIIRMLEHPPYAISLLPEYAVAESVAQGMLRTLDVTDFRIRMYRQVFYHRDKCCTREMSAYLQIVEEE